MTGNIFNKGRKKSYINSLTIANKFWSVQINHEFTRHPEKEYFFPSMMGKNVNEEWLATLLPLLVDFTQCNVIVCNL